MRPVSEEESRVRLIRVESIRIVNPRTREKKKYERVVESIRLLGLKKPITVRAAGADAEGRERFELVCGQGRLEAFQSLGRTHIPAIVREMSKDELLLASLAENLARRRVRPLEQIKLIQWMHGRGQPAAEIAAKTGLGAEYVRDILHLLATGEERLLEAVLHGRFPVTIAMRIADASDEESQRVLMEAYERKEMTQKSITAFKRIVDQRKHFGRQYGYKRGKAPPKTTAESLVRAYRLETQRQKLMVRKAKLCEVKLLSAAAAFRVLMADENWINLLRAEDLHTMPKFLAERVRELA